MKYSTDWLLDQLAREARIKYLFFWGNQPAKDGSITKSCLSQWWVADFVVAGVTYRSTEHWMMAEKARLFKDKSALALILAAKSPAEAKKLGREIQGFDPDLWEASKVEIVRIGNLHKFGQHKNLLKFLLATDGRVLVEASPVDTIWGIGLAADSPDAAVPARWQGPNLLGFIGLTHSTQPRSGVMLVVKSFADNSQPRSGGTYLGREVSPFHG